MLKAPLQKLGRNGRTKVFTVTDGLAPKWTERRSMEAVARAAWP